MVNKRHPAPKGQAGPAEVPLYGFQPPVGTPFGLEVSTVEDFFAQHDDWPWNPPRPGRATFHYLIAVTAGELLHDVDHLTRTVAPGQWLWVRPGHTQCWHPPGTARGPFILFEPDVLTPGTGRCDTYGRFADALELRFRELHRAADYAELLGCSVRTLSRAARDATGKGVRDLIGERRLLEARRLLGGARWDARSVAAHLGFSDTANFGRFFRDRTGLTPAAFASGKDTAGP